MVTDWKTSAENSTAEKLKIGDHTLALVDKVADKMTLKSLRVRRK